MPRVNAAYAPSPKAVAAEAKPSALHGAYERVFRDFLFPLYEGPIKRRNTHRHLAEYERTQWLDRDALETLQLTKLNALLAHCWSNVPFLKRYWTDAGARPEPLGHTAELECYPTITKHVISAHYAEMRARGLKGRVLVKTTGGSTGDPFKFDYSQESYAHRTATMWRGYRWAGADVGRRTAYVWGTGVPAAGVRGWKERVYHAAFNRLMLNAFTMTESNIGDYVLALERFRPRIVVGYVAPLVLIARWLREQRRSTHVPAAIITGAEALTRPDRDVIEAAFEAPVFNSYGCREFMLVAAECDRHDGLHTSADCLVVETVDESGRPVAAGASGDVCVTDLHNYAMPFVRYLNGDRATYGERACPCGRTLPLLISIDGRILDLIVTPDGRTIPGEFFVYVMLDFQNIRQYQIVQPARAQIDVKIVPRGAFPPADRERLVRKIAEGMGSEIEIRIVEVSEIPLTASGKRRVTVSQLQ